MATTKKSGGAKTTRSETVTVRLDPELRYLAEIAARTQRRTLSSYIEWAIQQSLRGIYLSTDAPNDLEGWTIAAKAKALWDVDEPDRFVRLALIAPDLLNYDEQKLWKLIRENGWLWYGFFNDHTDKWEWTVEEHRLIYERLRERWESFKTVAYDDADPAVLPKWTDSPFTKGSMADEEPRF